MNLGDIFVDEFGDHWKVIGSPISGTEEWIEMFLSERIGDKHQQWFKQGVYQKIEFKG